MPEQPRRADAATSVELTRRRALGLASWSTALAAVGAVAARSRALAGTATTTAAPVDVPVTAVPPSVVAPAAAAAAPSATPAPPSPAAAGDDLALHVVRRASFGPTPELVQHVRSVGVDAWLDQQLRPGEIDDAEVDAVLARLSNLDRGPDEFRSMHVFEDGTLADLRVAALVRAVRSNRHLLEVMVDLWHDQLAASADKHPVAWHLPTYDRNAIRPHALGRYVDLLQAVTRSGAMLEYLDTAGSSAPDVNENHGRELLELHTVGRGSGYGESDVVGAARVLSGWTITSERLEVVFDPARHHPGPASVLGWSTPGRQGADGAADLDALLAHLASHPATARRLATSLARRFVADAPPAGLIDSTAAAYLAAGTDIAATLRHLFGSADFRGGSSMTVRRPFDLFAAQLRATAATLEVPNTAERLVPLPDPMQPLDAPLVDSTTRVIDPVVAPVVDRVVGQRPIAATVTQVLRRNGQPLFAAPNPSGHSLAGVRWSSGDALLRRWTLAAHLANDGLDGIHVDPPSLAPGATTIGAAVDALALRCVGAVPSAATRDAALAVLERAGGDPLDDPSLLRPALAFLLAAPEVQVR